MLSQPLHAIGCELRPFTHKRMVWHDKVYVRFAQFATKLARRRDVAKGHWQTPKRAGPGGLAGDILQQLARGLATSVNSPATRSLGG